MSATRIYSPDLKIPSWVFLLITAVYCCAFRVDIMDIDASQYAEISREMAKSHNWLQVFDHGKDYLDKPPFLFWLSALSIRIFGASNFAYRLPSLLFALLAIYATYRLCRLLYNESTARISALVLATCQGLFLWTNDVRTDTILMSCVITAIWCIREAETARRWYWVIGGTLAIACGMMTKGPIALFVPLFAFGSDWVLRRKWKLLFSPWHLLDAALIALFLIPMCIGLYQQFDLHPEKLIDGHHHTSGLKFFFWTQSFGRITGENSWNNGADPFFLLSSMSWAFLPWILLFVTALFLNVRNLFQQRLRLVEGQEFLTTGGFLLTYLSLCISKYQLPHYILVAFPLAAIVTGKLIYDLISSGKLPKMGRIFSWIQSSISALLMIGVLLILLIVFPAGPLAWIVYIIAIAVWAIVWIRNDQTKRILWVSGTTMILINIFLTNHFYYQLMKYQCGSVMGKYLYQHHIPANTVMSWNAGDPLECIHYYAKDTIENRGDYPVPIRHQTYMLTQVKQLSSLDSIHQAYSVLKKGRLFKVSELSPEFLNYKSRDQVTQEYCLIYLY